MTGGGGVLGTLTALEGAGRQGERRGQYVRALISHGVSGRRLYCMCRPPAAPAHTTLPAVATAALALDGITFKGQTLRLRRPNDYTAPVPAPGGPPIVFRLGELGLVSSTVPDGPNKVFVGGLPHALAEPSVKELLEVSAILCGTL